jgi:hypothetical protein
MAICIGAGFIQLIKRTEDLARIQVDMDQCTGENILFVRAAIKAMSASYFRLEAYRTTTTAICLYLPACPLAMEVFTPAAEIEVAIQTAVRAMWIERQYRWRLRLSCKTDFKISRGSFPKFPFEVSDPLLLSSKIRQELQVIRGKVDPVTLTTRYRNMISTAETRKSEASREWTVRWTQ